MIEILLSTYNGATYLPAQLDSILNQSYTQWHLTIRDDGSTDATLSVLRDYESRYPQSIHLDPSQPAHLGSLRSFEYLLTQCKEQYAMLADQDDVWLPEKIERTYNAMLQAEKQFGRSNALLVYTNLRPVDKALKPLGESFWQYARIQPNLLEDKCWLAVNNSVSGCTTLINRAALDIVTPFGKQAQVHDAVMALQVLQHNGHLIRLDEPTMLYRLHDNNCIGGTKVEVNGRYIWFKIRTWKQVIARNFNTFRQAQEIIHIHPLTFILHRIIYLIRR